MDIVGFETAKRLKEAGFPQPIPAPGQVWYAASKTPYTLSLPSTPPSRWYANSHQCVICMVEPEVYAPGVADLLRELPEYNLIYRHDRNEWAAVPRTDEHPATISGVKSAAETIAGAWLIVNEENNA